MREGIITIKRAEDLLRARGYYDGPMDDIDDSAFPGAVKEFQKDNKLNRPTDRPNSD